MMNLFSTTLNGDIDNRFYFHDAESVVRFLRNAIEKEDCIYPTKISTWQEDRKRTKLTCTLMWTRVDPITHEVKNITKRIVCHEPDEMVESCTSVWLEREYRYLYTERELVTRYTYKRLAW